MDAEFQGTSGRRALLSATSDVKYAGASTEALGERSSHGSRYGDSHRSPDTDRSYRPGAPSVRLTATQVPDLLQKL